MPSQELLNTPATVSDYAQLTGSVALTAGRDVALLQLRGEDRKEWLQGQVTNDVRLLQVGGVLSFCVCSSTGQLLAVVDAWEDSSSIWLSCESSVKEAVLQRVEDTVILEDVVVEDFSGSYQLVSVLGPEALCWGIEQFQREGDAFSAAVFGAEVLVAKSWRSSWAGWDIWLPDSGQEALETLSLVGPEASNIVRLEAGIPKAGVDYSDKTLVPELGERFVARHVSYSKGCYMGQEVLMRIYSRGHTNRTWSAMISEAPISAGTTLMIEGVKAGTVTSSVVSPMFGPISAAYLRNELAMEGTRLATEGGVEARVTNFPIV